MSGVFERNRSMSRVGWVWNAREIRHEVDSLARSEKVVPKSARFTHGNRLCDHAAELVYAVRRAYLRYPNTAAGVIERRRYLQEAIDACWLIVEDLQNIKDEGFPVNVNRFDRVAELLDDEIAMLMSWKRNTKLQGKTPVSERIKKKEAELSELYLLQTNEEAENP